MNLAESIVLENAVRLENDLVKGVHSFDVDGGHGSYSEMRFLTDTFYEMQRIRIALDNQIRSMRDSKEPHTILDWASRQASLMEKQVERSLKAYTNATLPGRWLQGVKGIGPVLAANFLSHLDVTQTETAGGFWKFAGLDPTVKWGKGEKRPWNADLKTACWKASDSWVKLKNHADSFYSGIYVKRKEYEIARNESGGNKETAERTLTEKNFGKTTEAFKAYTQGKLPDGQIDNRARRYAVKLFLSHLHHVMYVDHYGKLPPKPFAISHLGHAHMIHPPGWPVV